MIISHLDALNPAACQRPVPSCTIFSRSGLPQGRRPRPPCACPASSFTGALRHKHRTRCNTAITRRPTRSLPHLGPLASARADGYDANRNNERERERARLARRTGRMQQSRRSEIPRTTFIPPLSRLQLPPICSLICAAMWVRTAFHWGGIERKVWNYFGDEFRICITLGKKALSKRAFLDSGVRVSRAVERMLILKHIMLISSTCV